MLALHLCGGDGVRSPDHWVEIDMVDLGDKVRFSPMAALPLGLDRHYDQSLELPHPAEKSFLCRLTLNGDTNLTELTVKTAEGWQRICDPIELPLRTIHTEVKLHGSQGTAGAEETTSQAWFNNVRIYPRPESHHVGIRLVRPDGGQIWFRENGGWPPKTIDSAGKTRSIEDIEVQLCTADGRPVASVRSSNMGFYLLPLRDAPWDVYPVAAEVRVLLDGKVLGKPLQIECQGVQGLYPESMPGFVGSSCPFPFFAGDGRSTNRQCPRYWPPSSTHLPLPHRRVLDTVPPHLAYFDSEEFSWQSQPQGLLFPRSCLPS